jgi:hypothetical protein
LLGPSLKKKYTVSALRALVKREVRTIRILKISSRLRDNAFTAFRIKAELPENSKENELSRLDVKMTSKPKTGSDENRWKRKSAQVLKVAPALRERI